MYGRYQSHEDRRNKLGMKAAYKALDIPDDDMHINAPRTETHNHYHAPAEAGKEGPSLARKLLPLVASAILGSAVPMAAAWHYGWFDSNSPTGTDTNTRYTIEAMEGE